MIDAKVLRIKESGTLGVYKFSIDGIDISERIDRAEMFLYYGRHDEKGVRLVIGADFLLPERYQMTIYRSKENGSIPTGDADSRQNTR